MTIRVLSNDIVKLIRAGEVIERPVSIVKELIDNSLDANSDTIKICYEKGGIDFLSVEDNGTGISKDDLSLALVNHATSKFNNIDYIDSLGFRGEALSSIAHVAEIEIISRTANDIAWKIISPKTNDILPASGSIGTYIQIRNLFNNFPARKEFLKSPNYEGSLIKKEVQEFALNYHQITFNVKNGNKEVCSFPKTNSKENRIRQIYGKEFIDNAVYITNKDSANNSLCNFVEFEIFIPEPTWNKHGSIGQHIFINGRSIKHLPLTSMLKSVYSGISKNNNPDFICYMNIPFDMVNCNIHPNKKEVRIKDENNLFQEIQKFILDKIGNKKTSAKILSEVAKEYAKPVIYSDQDTKKLPLGRPIGLLKNNFVLSENADGLIIIDLHAAHERIVLQKLLTHIHNMNRIDIEPELIHLSHDAYQTLYDNQNLFNHYGFTIIYMDDSISITQIPEYIDKRQLQECIKKMIAIIKSNPFLDPEKELMTELCSELACHNAFRTGDDISIDEINHLLREMERTEFVAQCNHGRPTTISMDMKDIYKLFGRT